MHINSIFSYLNQLVLFWLVIAIVVISIVDNLATLKQANITMLVFLIITVIMMFSFPVIESRANEYFATVC
jgi:hypothetical protein